jgi:hypothetical protein
MVSERRIEANRRNAQLSSGPCTKAGKARSSLNALRHGITGQVSIMTTEDRAAHDKFVQELIERFRPEDALELQFASLIAEDFWRLQRIRAVENDILALGAFSEAANIDVEHPEVHTSITRARTFLEHSKELERLTLYEQRINRAIEKNRRQLDELQAERKRQRQEALDQACLLSQIPAASEEDHADATPTPVSVENGFVFSSDEIERAIHHRSRLLKAEIIRKQTDAQLKTRLFRRQAAAQ